MLDAAIEIRGLLIGGSVAECESMMRALERAGHGQLSLDYVSDYAPMDQHLAEMPHHIYFVSHFADMGAQQFALIKRIRESNPVSDIILVVENEDEDVIKMAQTSGCDDFIKKTQLQPSLLAIVVSRATRKVMALQEMRKLNAKLALIERAAEVGTWEWDLRSNSSTWSEKQYQLFGIDYATERVVRYDTWRSVIHSEDIDAVEAELGRAIVGQAIFDMEFRIIPPQSADQNRIPATRWLRGMGLVQRDASGAAVRMTGINFDITNQKVSLRALENKFVAAMKPQRRINNIFHTHFDSSPDCMFQVVFSEDNRLVYEAINPAGLKHAALTTAEIIGKTPEEALGPEVGGAIMQGLRTVCATRQPYHYQPSFDMATGPVIYDAVYIPIFDENGVLDSIFGCARDITLLRRTQSMLYQAQKMEAMGQLASGIAHDFNNVLNTLYSSIQLLGAQIASGHGEKLLAGAHKAVAHGEQLSSRLVNFSRPKNLTIASTDINKCIMDMTEILSRTLGTGIQLKTSLAENLWPARADCHQLEIAILNLAINSRDAMPDGGTLSISTRNVDAPLGPEKLMSGVVETVISDTGCGMSEEVLANATTAFFTTKPIGKGTGLGLSMVAETIRLMNGDIKIFSTSGIGTTIVLSLPKF